MCDFPLPQCNTGCVCMLISVKDTLFTCVGKTMCIRERIHQHDSGVGSTSTEPVHLRPCALLACISGFNSRNDLLLFVEAKWKQRRDQLIRQGINDVIVWARSGSEIISEIDEVGFGILKTDLTLVCLFND